jgi:serine/threonine protein kinase
MSKTIGKYNILRTLGSGGSCKVKLAMDTETNRKVAVKIMNDDMGEDEKALLKTEVETMVKLDHKHIVDYLEWGRSDYVKKGKAAREVDFIALELASGGELFDFVSNSGPFDEDVARYFFHQFMDGLGYCHAQSVVHRDLKPENLLLDKNYDIKIADFGFAASAFGTMKDENGNYTGLCKTALGTSSYMAPEIHL